MIRHPLTLEHIAAQANIALQGCVLTEAWTQEKNVANLRFESPDTGSAITVVISTDAEYGTVVLSSSTHRARKNSINVFPTLIGKTCLAVVKAEGDRIISILFDTVQLHALLYSGGSGNVILTQEGTIIDALHEKKTLISQAFVVTPHPLQLGRYLEGLDSKPERVIERARASNEFYVLQKDDQVLFSVLPLPDWEITFRTGNVFDAIRRTISERRRHKQSTQIRSVLERDLKKEEHRLLRAIENVKKDVDAGSRAAQYRHQADLLMSYPDPSLTGAHQIDVEEWDGTIATIPLDASLSIVENAQRLYEKARRSEKSVDERNQRLPIIEKQLAIVRKRIDQLEHTVDSEELHDTAKYPASPRAEPISPYRTFVLDDSYTLYVGKNAANNDQLTMKFAKQNDWWFHARGSSGSHCVLKGGAPNVKPPRAILEAAAAIAAYYSGSRNASWTPVVYTQRKYIRKPKGAHVGAVRLEREEVIMVKPALPTGRSEEGVADR